MEFMLDRENLAKFLIFFSELGQGELSLCADFSGVKLVGSSDSGSIEMFIGEGIDESLEAKLPDWVTQGLKKFSGDLHIYIHDEILLTLDGTLYISFPIES